MLSSHEFSKTCMNLQNILELLDTNPRSISSTHPRINPHTGDINTLPFGIKLDNDTDGIYGVATPQGALEIVTAWARNIADSRDETPTKHACAYLAEHAKWSENNFDDYEMMSDEIEYLYHKFAPQAGYTHITDGTCPACGKGTLKRPYTNHGLDPITQCDHCQKKYNTETKELEKAQYRAILHNTTTWHVPLQQAIYIAHTLGHLGVTANYITTNANKKQRSNPIHTKRKPGEPIQYNIHDILNGEIQ